MRVGKRGLALMCALVLTGCTAAVPEEPVVNPPQSLEPAPPSGDSQSQSGGKQSGAEQAANLPFGLTVPVQSVMDVRDARVAVAGEDFELLGTAPVGPFPSSVLPGGNGFGSLRVDGGAANIESLRFEVGEIRPDEPFAPLVDIAQPLRELPGSNPAGLSFEPQNSSVFGDWVVWREASAGGPQTAPTLDSDDWRVIAWNRKSGEVTEMASAFLLHGNRAAPYATWDVAPSTDGKFVYFEATVPTSEGEWVPSVISIPLAEPGNVAVVAQGTSPYANSRDGGVFWADGLTVRQDGRELFALSGEGWWISALRASQDLLVVSATSDAGAWLLVWDLETSSMVAAINTDSDLAFPSVSGRSVVWGNGSGNGDPSMYRWEVGEPIQWFGQLQGLSLPVSSDNTVVFPEVAGETIEWKFAQFH